jgi:hypothetical protein
MLSRPTAQRIFRASAWYDLIVTAPFVTPFSLALVYQLFDSLHAALGLPPLGTLPPEGMLFGNFFGSVVLVWATLRLRRDDLSFARYDAVARALFSLWMILALIAGASPLIWGLLVIELAFCVAQALPVSEKAATGRA